MVEGNDDRVQPIERSSAAEVEHQSENFNLVGITQGPSVSDASTTARAVSSAAADAATGRTLPELHIHGSAISAADGTTAPRELRGVAISRSAGAGNAIESGISGAAASGSVVRDANGNVSGTLSDAAGTASSAVRDAAGNIAGTIRDAAGSLSGTVRDAAGNVAGTVSDAAGTLSGVVRDAAGNVAGTIRDAAGAITSGLRDGSAITTGVLRDANSEGRGDRQPGVNDTRQLQSREDLIKDLKSAGTAVRDAVSQLPKDQQEKFASLHSNKDGTYSQEQLSFIKSHCPKEAYSAAQGHDNAMRGLHNMDAMQRKMEQGDFKKQGPNDRLAGMSNEELAKNAKKDAGIVRDGISKLDPAAQKEYAKLEPNKDGTLSKDQLSFIKKNCDKDTYAAAQDLNRTLDTMNGVKHADGGKQVERNADNVKERIAMKQEAMKAHAQVDKAVSQLDPVMQKAFNRLDNNKDGSYSDKQLNFIKSNCGPEALKAAQHYNKLNESLNNSNGPTDGSATSRANDRAADRQERSPETLAKLAAHYKNELVKSEKAVNNVVSEMTPEQQKAFGDLKSNKDGTYSQEQLKFLKDTSKEGYSAASTYNAALRAINDLSSPNSTTTPAEGRRDAERRETIPATTATPAEGIIQGTNDFNRKLQPLKAKVRK